MAHRLKRRSHRSRGNALGMDSISPDGALQIGLPIQGKLFSDFNPRAMPHCHLVKEGVVLESFSSGEKGVTQYRKRSVVDLSKAVLKHRTLPPWRDCRDTRCSLKFREASGVRRFTAAFETRIFGTSHLKFGPLISPFRR